MAAESGDAGPQVDEEEEDSTQKEDDAVQFSLSLSSHSFPTSPSPSIA